MGVRQRKEALKHYVSHMYVDIYTHRKRGGGDRGGDRIVRALGRDTIQQQSRRGVTPSLHTFAVACEWSPFEGRSRKLKGCLPAL